MVLKSLEVVNFRNLKPAKLTLSPQINIFYGNNAQGKTNLIEAIYVLSFLKSFRAETEKDLILWDKESARIKGEFDSQSLSIELSGGYKTIRLNNIAKRALDVLGELGVSSFSPEDILIITGAPVLRRRFLDSLISSFDRRYLYNLATMQKILRNRNRVLQWLREGRNGDLESWDQQLAATAAAVWLRRLKTVAELGELIVPVSRKLLGKGVVKINYQTKLEINQNTPQAEVETLILAALKEVHSEEVRRATTLVGPQRDDFSIVLEEPVGDTYLTKDVQAFGSRGEQRVAILSLKLAELDLMEKEKGERPVLLLDDVLSEFDSDHRDHLLSLITRQQTFITTTDLSLFSPSLLQKAACFKVEAGSAVEDKTT